MMVRDWNGRWVINHNHYTEQVFDAANADVLPPWLDTSASDSGYTASVAAGLATLTTATPPGAGTDKMIDVRCLVNGGQIDLSADDISAVSLYVENARWTAPPGLWRFGVFDQTIGTNPNHGAHFVSQTNSGGGSMRLRFNNSAQPAGYAESTNLPGPATVAGTQNYLGHANFGLVLTRQRDPGRDTAKDAWWAYQMLSWNWPNRTGQETFVRRGRGTPIDTGLSGGAAAGNMEPGTAWPRIYWRTNGDTTPVAVSFRRLRVGLWYL